MLSRVSLLLCPDSKTTVPADQFFCEVESALRMAT